jgi:hypothetical protein
MEHSPQDNDCQTLGTGQTFQEKTKENNTTISIIYVILYTTYKKMIAEAHQINQTSIAGNWREQ